MANTALYPWLQSAFDHLDALRRDDRIPGALLIQGGEGLGKRSLALHLAARLLCLAPKDPLPCGVCHGCHLFKAGTHPDLKILEPEEAGKMIKVDQVRKVIQDLSLMSLYDGYRVIVIHPADQMNQNAANALLKTLEEPAPKNLIILVTHRPQRLLPTIRSRCQTLSIPRPQKDIALAFIKEHKDVSAAERLWSCAEGSPLRALEMAEKGLLEVRDQRFEAFIQVLKGQEDPVAMAQTWAEESPFESLDWVLSWLLDLVRLGLSDESPELLNEDLGEALKDLIQGLDVVELIHYRDAVSGYRAQLETTANRQLIFEAVLIGLAALGKSQRAAQGLKVTAI